MNPNQMNAGHRHFSDNHSSRGILKYINFLPSPMLFSFLRRNPHRRYVYTDHLHQQHSSSPQCTRLLDPTQHALMPLSFPLIIHQSSASDGHEPYFRSSFPVCLSSLAVTRTFVAISFDGEGGLGGGELGLCIPRHRIKVFHSGNTRI